MPGIKEAYASASEIDIVVTSTSLWSDKHSMLRQYMNLADESVDELEQAGCVGDILWQPIGTDGPFPLNSEIRAMTIMELDRLSDRTLADIGLHRGEIVSVVDELIAGGTTRRSRGFAQASSQPVDAPVTANDNIADLVA